MQPISLVVNGEIAVSAALDLAVPGQDPVSRRLHVTAVRRAVQKGFI